MASLYIHVPYCRRKCIYCDFYSCGEAALPPARFIDALVAEMRLRRGEISGSCSTLYIGGGTPSLLPAAELERLFAAVRDNFEIEEGAEVTAEVNPDDVTAEFCSLLRSLGVNRVSAGIQSLNDAELKAVGRRHDAAGARAAMRLLRDSFANVSFDIIFGLPGQTAESWAGTLTEVVAVRPDHLSAYSLMYEEGTPLTLLRERGRIKEVSDEAAVEMFKTLCRVSAEAGYRRYEVSNFALPGAESRHNTAYWLGFPYLGLGPSAHSYDGRRTRRANPADLRAYAAHFGGMPGADSFYKFYKEERLTDEELREEYILTRLRLAEGISLDDFRLRFGDRAYDALKTSAVSLERHGLVSLTDTHLSIPDSQVLTSDPIIVALL